MVVTHVVMWRVKDPSPERLDRLVSLLRSLKGNVPSIAELEVGRNAVPGDDACDVVLITRFDRFEDLDAYRVHPFHLEVANQISALKETRAVVDFAS